MRQFNITGMSCAACSARVENAVSSLDGVSSCSVNLLTNSMVVEGNISDDVIKSGYGATIKGEKVNNNVQNNEEKSILRRLIVSVCLLIPLMYISMGAVMLGAPIPKILVNNPIIIAVIEAAHR